MASALVSIARRRDHTVLLIPLLDQRVPYFYLEGDFFQAGWLDISLSWYWKQNGSTGI